MGAIATNGSTSSKFARIEQDLTFLFCESDAQLHLSSNFASCIRQLQLGGYSSVQEASYELAYDNATLAAIARHRRVLALFAALSPPSKLILEAHFSERPNPAPIRVYFGLHYALLALTPAAQATPSPIKAIATSILPGKRQGRLNPQTILAQAQDLLSSAFSEYANLERLSPKPPTSSAFHPQNKD